MIASDLSTQLGTPEVAIAPLANFKPAYVVAIDIQRFESIKDEAAILDAVWTIQASAGGGVRSGRTSVRVAVLGRGYEALAAAHSSARAQLSADIAAAIRADAEQKS